MLKGNLDVQNAKGFGPEGVSVVLRTNSLGLRDTLEPTEIPIDATVIAVQGDSTVAGFGLQPEETLSYQLERYLRAHAAGGRKYYVLNFGCNGYDPHQYTVQAEWLSKRYDVDILIMIFNLGNDYAATTLAHSYLIPRPYFTLTSEGLKLVYPHRPTNGQIYGYKFIPEYAQYNYLLMPLNGNSLVVDTDRVWSYSLLYITAKQGLYRILGGFESHRYSDDEINRAQIYSPYGTWKFVNPSLEPYGTHEALVSALLSQWKELAPESFVVLLPDKAQLSFELQEEHKLRAEQFQLGRLDFNLPTIYMLELCERAGIATIDPLPIFKDIPNGDKALYFPNDYHVNGKANELLAEQIGNVLLSQD